MKPTGTDEITEQASIGMLGITGRLKRGSDRYERFIDALNNLPPPPCKGCPLRERCGSEDLACEQFWQYTRAEDTIPWPFATPPTREPSRRLYKAVYRDSDLRKTPIRPRELVGYLPPETVRSIRTSTGTTAEIALTHKLTRRTIERIRSGDTYQWVPE